MEKIGRALRIVRQAKGLRAGVVAKEAGVSAPYLSLVESGRREPSLSVLEALATALAVPYETLILLAQSPDSQLRTDSPVAQRLAESVQRLAKAEEALSELLARENA